jgi:CRISPR-associated protein Cmr3
MKSKYQYQVRLRPLSKYFFGGERFFDENDGVFYFEKSREFPQQTSILGMLRYQLLLEEGLLKQTLAGVRIDSAMVQDAQSLIGESSFDARPSNSFGKIKGMSPLAIVDNQGEMFFPFPRKKETLEPITLQFLQGVKLYMGGTVRSEIPHFDNFDHKKGVEPVFQNLRSGTCIKHKDIFCEEIAEDEQIGMYKPYRKQGVVQQTEDRGFYKYQYCQLREGFSFAFFIGSDEPLPLRDTIVRFGKERTAFSLTVIESTSPFQNADIAPGEQVLLLSDAFLDGDWGEYCRGAVSDVISFRNLRYQVSKSDQNYDEKPGKPEKNGRLNLLRRGTLLWVSQYPEHAKKLQDLFEEQKAFKTIGYNYYHVLKNNI